jgi:UDP-N-acetylglucosamine--N-acetylmuramyl-(pentapeptide) pyrophosphoryl-undecaprenol N-acetylglucosamine transferase
LKKLNLLIAAGGTGGHLFPAVAVADEIKKHLGNKLEIFFTGRPDKIEKNFAEKNGYEFFPMDISGLTKKFSLSTLMLPFKIRAAVNASREVIRKSEIHAVIATGGYIGYPPGLAIKKEGGRLYLIEANVNPGKALKMLCGRADRIFTSFADSRKYFDDKYLSKIIYTGNPVREFITRMPDRMPSLEKFGFTTDNKTVLVFGGSLGARSINYAVEKNINNFRDAGINLIWQTGKNYSYEGIVPKNVKITEFIDDMASAYAAADMVISRSGATTVAELAIAGKPSLLVPLKSATNNEQELNALTLEKSGAAVMIRDDEIEARLWKVLQEILNSDDKLEQMHLKAAEKARPDAAAKVASIIMKDYGFDE